MGKAVAEGSRVIELGVGESLCAGNHGLWRGGGLRGGLLSWCWGSHHGARCWSSRCMGQVAKALGNVSWAPGSLSSCVNA